MGIDDVTSVTEIIRNVATALGIIIGGGWALWKWQFSEDLRKKRDEVSIEGELNADVFPLADGKHLVLVTSHWKNMTKQRVEIDCKNTMIEVFKFTQPKSEGYYNLDTDIHKATETAHPFETTKSLHFGPLTQSSFDAHFVLPPGAIYVVRWNLVKKQTDDEDWARTWIKTTAIDLLNTTDGD